MGRLRFGTIGPSTHFLELQEVEEILDPVAAEHLGIHAGQVTLQFHNGGGVLTGQIGAMYAKRKSASRMLRAEMSVQKPLTHLATAHSREQMASRLANYFSDDCPSIPMSGDDGRRALLATRLSMNYGFAYRMATYSALRSIAKSTLGATTNLVVDSPHNSVYEEEVDGAPAFVHRHNACRAFHGGHDDRPPGVRRDRSTAAAARYQPDIVISVRARSQRSPQPVLGVPWLREHHLGVRAIRPVGSRSARSDDGEVPLRRCRTGRCATSR